MDMNTQFTRRALLKQTALNPARRVAQYVVGRAAKREVTALNPTIDLEKAKASLPHLLDVFTNMGKQKTARRDAVRKIAFISMWLNRPIHKLVRGTENSIDWLETWIRVVIFDKL